MKVLQIGARKSMSKGDLLKLALNQRDTIEALKSSLARRRNPEGNVLTRATVEELMLELESRPREEVEAYMERNAPKHDEACEDRERRFPGTGCTCKGVLPENAQVIEVPSGTRFQ